MRERILEKGISDEKVLVIPPWSHDVEVRFDAAGRERFRKTHGLDDKFVVMYSGNHSPCHPLDTLLGAAHQLAYDPSIVFCFIGGGTEFRKIRRLKSSYTEVPTHCRALLPSLNPQPSALNLLTLPYRPLFDLPASLSAADLHVVTMGDPFVGLVHPCKIYNILPVGARVLYIGPEPSHVTEIFIPTADGTSPPGPEVCNSESVFTRAAHGDVQRVVEHILSTRKAKKQPRVQNENFPFSKATLLPQLLSALDSHNFNIPPPLPLARPAGAKGS